MTTPLQAHDSLPIEWSMSTPPTPARTWKALNTGPLPKQALELEQRLQWPAGTLFILEQVFTQGWGRSTGWRMDETDETWPAVAQAAKVFRRGVACGQAPQTPEIQTGRYNIEIIDPGTAHDQFLRNDEVILVDSNLAQHWTLPDHAHIITLDESQKNLSSVAHILEILRAADHSKKTVSILGGGVLADTAAFAASLLGWSFRLIPTTLLAMVDACVGGKTGVNFHPYGKNQIGLFAFPSEVIIWTEWLKSLTPRDYRAGLAEALKHCFLAGESEIAAKLATQPEPSALTSHIKRLIEIKAEVVRQDPAENGIRASLNLGHTLAHALEAYSYQSDGPLIHHGEAVSVGLAYAIALSKQVAGLACEEAAAMLRCLKDSGSMLGWAELRQFLGGADIGDSHVWHRLCEFMQQDKKNDNPKQIQWVLLQGWGQLARRRREAEDTWRYTVPVDLDSMLLARDELLTYLKN